MRPAIQDTYLRLASELSSFAECRRVFLSGDLKQALKSAESALCQSNITSNPLAHWSFKLFKAEILGALGRHDEVLSLVTAETPPFPVDENDILTRREMIAGYAECHLGHFEPAERILQKVRDEALRFKYELLLGEIELRRGTLAFRRRNWSASRKSYEVARRVALRCRDRYVELCAMIGVAKVIRETAGHKAALPLFKRGLTIAIECQYRALIGKVAAELGHSYCVLGELDEAEEYLKKAAAVSTEVGQLPDCHIIMSNMGNVWMRRDRPDKAIECYSNALDVARQVKDPWSAMRWSYNLAVAHVKTQEYETAQRFVNDAYRISRELDQNWFQSSCLTLSGLIGSKLTASTK